MNLQDKKIQKRKLARQNIQKRKFTRQIMSKRQRSVQNDSPGLPHFAHVLKCTLLIDFAQGSSKLKQVYAVRIYFTVVEIGQKMEEEEEGNMNDFCSMGITNGKELIHKLRKRFNNDKINVRSTFKCRHDVNRLKIVCQALGMIPFLLLLNMSIMF